MPGASADSLARSGRPSGFGAAIRQTRQRITRPIVIATLLVVSTVSWRRGVYFSGGVDPVVATKAALSCLALWLSIDADLRTAHRNFVHSRGIWLLSGYLLISLFGAAYTATTLSSSLVLAVRIAVAAASVFCMLRAYPTLEVIRAFIVAMAAVATVAALTDLRSIGGGRLAGGIPPLQPNELAQLCGLVAVALLWRCLRGAARPSHAVALMVFLGAVWLTGSRTGLVALAVAVFVCVVQTRRVPVGFVTAVLAAAPFAIYLAAATNVVSSFLSRGGTQNLATLNARTVAWSAAFNLHHAFWDTWFGSGISMVRIPVTAKFREEQILDSSWISALVQAGLLGIGLLAVWVLYSISIALLAPPGYRQLATAVLAFVVTRSFLETGLLDATPAFMIFFLICAVGRDPQPPVAVAAGRGSPRSHEGEVSKSSC